MQLTRRSHGQSLKPRTLSPDDGNTRVFEIPCQLAEHSANALGDYGAKRNSLREGVCHKPGADHHAIVLLPSYRWEWKADGNRGDYYSAISI
jgi:hypothetical protein